MTRGGTMPGAQVASRVVHEGPDRFEAQRVLEALESEGIAANLAGPRLDPLGTLPPFGSFRVRVQELDAPRAAALIAAMLSEPALREVFAADDRDAPPEEGRGPDPRRRRLMRLGLLVLCAPSVLLALSAVRGLRPRRSAAPTELDAIFPSPESLRKAADQLYEPRGGGQPRASRLYDRACGEGDLPSCARLEQMRLRHQLSGAERARAEARAQPRQTAPVR